MTETILIVSSDWHLDAYTAGFSRHEDVKAAAMRVAGAALALAERVGALHVLFAFLGDLCDPDANRSPRCIEVAVAVALLLRTAGIRSRWLVGNHDVIEDGSGTSTLAPLAALDPSGEVVRVLSEPAVEVINGKAFCWLPYVPRCLAYDPVEFVHRAVAAAPQVQVVAGHLNVEGIVPGSETNDMGRGRDAWFPLSAVRELWPDALLLNGHYHRAQVDPAGVVIPGSLARLTFGEQDNDPGYLEIELSEPPSIRAHRVPTRTLLTVPPPDGQLVPEDLTGALVRVLPPAGTSEEAVQVLLEVLQERGAKAVKVHPTPSAPVELPQARLEPVARARGPKQVVLELASKAVGVPPGDLIEEVTDIMSEVGL